METLITSSQASHLREPAPTPPFLRFRRFCGLCGPITAVLVTILLSSCAFAPDESVVPPLSGGIQVNEPDHAVWLQAVSAAGLDAVQVTLYARQLHWNSAELIVPDSAPSVVAEIRAAKAAGLRVTLVLRVALEQGLAENRLLWHGMIWPPEADVGAWFDNYRAFALWAAGIAATESVDLMAIGSELNSMTSTVRVAQTPDLYAYFLDPARTAQVRDRLVGCAVDIPENELAPDLQFVDGHTYPTLEAYLRDQEASDRTWTRHITGASGPGAVDIDVLNRRREIYESHWRDLIEAVRTVYPGPLSYAANFDQVQDVGFWDALDAVGVNAYFPLSRWGLRDAELQSALTASWEQIAADLNGIASRQGGAGQVLPVVLFELGWTRKAGSTVRPFSYHRVEALETAGTTPDGSIPLTCVHWATQPEDPHERLEAIRALDRVVARGGFPTLRGFTLWKLSTIAAHREVEPFVVILQSDDEADRQYLEVAASLAARLRRRGAR